jgi:predicted nucleic acid-binding Zn ribbon protein
VGIIFKGSGFYVTDNRAKSSTATPGTTTKTPKASEETKSSGSSDGSTEKSDSTKSED